MTSKYAVMLRQHWEEHRPRELSQMQDPEKFFREMGMQVAEAIAAAEEDLEETLEPETDYQARVGQLNQIAATAREQVLREMLPPAEDEQNPAEPVSPEALEMAAISRELKNL